MREETGDAEGWHSPFPACCPLREQLSDPSLIVSLLKPAEHGLCRQTGVSLIVYMEVMQLEAHHSVPGPSFLRWRRHCFDAKVMTGISGANTCKMFIAMPGVQLVLHEFQQQLPGFPKGSETFTDDWSRDRS